ncbi:Argininosuccinate synthase [Phycisphaerae bacterium RAS1]|nr:Argininosuccinate synthase [Phycisphaerae bacterium RAS1]
MSKKVALAFSGGLDTTYCAVRLREQGCDVHALTVQTGGFDADELAAIEKMAARAGTASYRLIDARRELFDDVLRYLVFANALRGGVYPLCVSAERVVQARCVAEYGRRIGASALCHGSTGAGNDQVRFDVGFRAFAPELEILTPIRSEALSREQETAWLAGRGIEIPPKTTRYSINRGLWGTTIGGAETHRSDGVLPDEAYVWTAGPQRWPASPEDLTISFDGGVPTALTGRKLDPVALIELLNAQAGRHGVGRGMHVGDTILGIKGRVAFEAPAAQALIAAHRELEKLVLSRQQLFWKQTLGELYGAAVHEARYFDPLMRDVEAFLTSSQRRVSGDVIVRLFAGQAVVLGATSPWSLMDPEIARYGESSALWNGAEAAGFCKLYGMQDWLLGRVASSQ